MDQYEIMEQIGRGAFGAAILVLHKLEKKKYVLKKIRLARQTERCRKAAHQEMALIARLQHPYILEFKEAWVEKSCYVCIVTGYCEGGDMAYLMKKYSGQYFSEEKLLKWFTQLLLAVEYLHSNFVLHRDLKCSNIFLTKDQDIRLGDFGPSKTLKADDLANTIVGTPNYMCPELLADIPYGFKSDIWSLGCCMYEMAAHRHAFKAFDMAGLVSKINHSSIGPLPKCYSPSLKTLIKSMLRKNPENRPSASELLKLPFLQPYIDQHRKSHDLASPTSPTKPMSDSHSSSSSFSDRCSLMSSKTTKKGIILNPIKKATSRKEPEDRKPPNNVQRYENKPKQPKIIKDIIMALKEGQSRENTSPKVSRSGYIDSSIKDNAEKLPGVPEKGSSDSTKHIQETHSLKHQAYETDVNKPKPSCATPYSSQSERVESSSMGHSDSSEDQSMVCSSEESKRSSDDKVVNVNTLDVDSFRERAEALEGLLELCADMLKQNRLEELSVILKPFGKEKVSPRDTAIWLAQSLKGMMLEGSGWPS